ncbi:MAG: hypothetical protein KGL39_42675 [Patescibacteria group bacterium]|nr:hypothetical protein [Patescibacteria group bacterium]
MAKGLDDFKSKHDPSTIIARLQRDLATAQSQVGMQATIARALELRLPQLEKYEPEKWTLTQKTDHKSPGVPTLFLSDIHCGEVVDPAQVEGCNSYNMDIFRKRLRHTIETAVRLLTILDRDMRYPGLFMPLGGDMVSGDIHEELQTTNELPTIPTVLELCESLVDAITFLLTYFPSIVIPCVSGNHGRNTRKTWAKNRNATSFDWMLYAMLARRFANEPRVKFYIAAGSDASYSIFNVRYLLTHGDQFRAGDSIIGPIGPIFRGNQKKLARNTAIGKPYDVMLNGHWHKYIHTAQNITNGSMKGYDEYAMSENYGFEPPQQALWVTHPRYGITFRMPVLCEPPRAPKDTPWHSVAA